MSNHTIVWLDIEACYIYNSSCSTEEIVIPDFLELVYSTGNRKWVMNMTV